jgi:hypothetical protein
VKGEERRMQVSRLLRRMKNAFDDAAGQEATRESGAGLEEELRRQVSQQAQDRAETDT